MSCYIWKYSDDGGKLEEAVHYFKEKVTWLSTLTTTAHGTCYPDLGWTTGFILVSLGCYSKNITDWVSKTVNIHFSEL